MKKIIEIPLGWQNQERMVAPKLKNVERRFEYAYKHKGNLYLVFSSQEMKIKTVVKQFKACNKEEGIKKFLKQTTFENDGVNSVWRVAGCIMFARDRYLVFFEKTLDN